VTVSGETKCRSPCCSQLVRHSKLGDSSSGEQSHRAFVPPRPEAVALTKPEATGSWGSAFGVVTNFAGGMRPFLGRGFCRPVRFASFGESSRPGWRDARRDGRQRVSSAPAPLERPRSTTQKRGIGALIRSRWRPALVWPRSLRLREWLLVGAVERSGARRSRALQPTLVLHCPTESWPRGSDEPWSLDAADGAAAAASRAPQGCPPLPREPRHSIGVGSQSCGRCGRTAFA